MPHIPAAVASGATPVLLVVVGLAVLAVGLALLTGDRARPRAGSDSTEPSAGMPAAPPVPCDWSAWLEQHDGTRLALRRPARRDCCQYVVRVRDLDPVPAPLDETTDALVWTGRATRVSRDEARTPTTRDLVTRRASTGPGTATASVSLDRTAGPTITTASPPPHGDEDPTGERTDPVEHAARLWRRHLDDLHARGARPAPTDGPPVPPMALQHRVEVLVRVERGCEVAAHPTRAEVTCEARLTGTALTGTPQLGAPLLASWGHVSGTTVVADTPVDVPAGLARWRPATQDTAHGVTATAATGPAELRAHWTGRQSMTVDERRVAVVLGSAVDLVLDVEDTNPDVTAALEATTAATARIHLGTADGRGGGCSRCLPELEVRVGRAGGPDVRSIAAGSTPEVAIRFDGRTIRLRAPVPDGGRRSWTVAAEDDDATQPVTSVR